MVEESTKTFRGALAFFRGASYRSLLMRFANPAIRSNLNRMIDLITTWRKVNATNKNKRVLFEWRGFGRRISPVATGAEKECFCLSFRAERSVDPESITAVLWIWIPDLPLCGNPE
jgi:hypothetical protein